jgi:hypothetical protein
VDSATVFYTFGSSGIWERANGTLVDPLGSFDWNVPSPAKGKIVRLKVVLKDALGDRKQTSQLAFVVDNTPRLGTLVLAGNTNIDCRRQGLRTS